MTDLDSPPPKTDERIDDGAGERTPEQLLTGLRKISQMAVLFIIFAALLLLLIFRGHFFFAPPTLTPPRIAELPLDISRSEEMAVEPNSPHENELLPPPKIDWKTTRITSAIPGAYAVIYREQQAAGIVIDGEYVRVYQPIKMWGDIPVGDYFIVARELVRNQMRIRFSYPSPEDAKNFWSAGKIDEAEYREIVAAADQKKLPAKLSPEFGSPLVVISEPQTANRAIVLLTEQLREFWTALPDGAPVMIR